MLSPRPQPCWVAATGRSWTYFSVHWPEAHPAPASRPEVCRYSGASGWQSSFCMLHFVLLISENHSLGILWRPFYHWRWWCSSKYVQLFNLNPDIHIEKKNDLIYLTWSLSFTIRKLGECICISLSLFSIEIQLETGFGYKCGPLDSGLLNDWISFLHSEGKNSSG